MSRQFWFCLILAAFCFWGSGAVSTTYPVTAHMWFGAFVAWLVGAVVVSRLDTLDRKVSWLLD